MPDIQLQAYANEIARMIESGQLDEALAHCRHILIRFPSDLEVTNLMARAYEAGGQQAEAEKAYRDVLRMDPERWPAHASLARLYEAEGRLPDAVEEWELAFDLASGNSEVRRELQRLRSQRSGAEEEALPLTRAALGRVYAQNGLHDKAIREYQNALQQQPDREGIRVSLAESFWRSGRRLEAVETCLDVLHSTPQCLKANLILGQIFLSSGQEPSAQERLALARALDPENVVAQGMMGADSPLPAEDVLVGKWEPPSPVESSVEMAQAAVSDQIEEPPEAIAEPGETAEAREPPLQEQVEPLPEWVRLMREALGRESPATVAKAAEAPMAPESLHGEEPAPQAEEPAPAEQVLEEAAAAEAQAPLLAEQAVEEVAAAEAQEPLLAEHAIEEVATPEGQEPLLAEQATEEAAPTEAQEPLPAEQLAEQEPEAGAERPTGEELAAEAKPQTGKAASRREVPEWVARLAAMLGLERTVAPRQPVTGAPAAAPELPVAETQAPAVQGEITAEAQLAEEQPEPAAAPEPPVAEAQAPAAQGEIAAEAQLAEEEPEPIPAPEPPVTEAPAPAVPGEIAAEAQVAEEEAEPAAAPGVVQAPSGEPVAAPLAEELAASAQAEATPAGSPEEVPAPAGLAAQPPLAEEPAAQEEAPAAVAGPEEPSAAPAPAALAEVQEEMPVVAPAEVPTAEQAPGEQPAQEAPAPAEDAAANRLRITALEEQVANQPRAFLARIELARRFGQARDWNAALAQYEELIVARKLLPAVAADLQQLTGEELDQVQLYRLLGDAYTELGRSDRAGEMYRLARETLKRNR